MMSITLGILLVQSIFKFLGTFSAIVFICLWLAYLPGKGKIEVLERRRWRFWSFIILLLAFAPLYAFQQKAEVLISALSELKQQNPDSSILLIGTLKDSRDFSGSKTAYIDTLTSKISAENGVVLDVGKQTVALDFGGNPANSLLQLKLGDVLRCILPLRNLQSSVWPSFGAADVRRGTMVKFEVESSIDFKSEGSFEAGGCYELLPPSGSKTKHPLHWLIEGSESLYAKSGATVVSAAALGDDSFLTEWHRTLFKKLGIYHVLVVSGMHIMLLLSLAQSICRPVLRFNSALLTRFSVAQMEYLLSLLMLLFYLSMIPIREPVLRAAIMYVLAVIIRVQVRKTSGVRALFFAVALLQLIWPLSIFTASLQMSMAALFGLRVGGYLSQRLAQYDKFISFSRFVPGAKIFLDYLCACASASLAVIPFQLFWFDEFYPYSIWYGLVLTGVMAYLLVIPSVTLVIAQNLGIPGIDLLMRYYFEILGRLIDQLHYVTQ